jgi:hypothetical protein
MTDTPLQPVRRAELTDADTVAAIIAQTFHDLLASHYLIPDPDLRAKLYPTFFKLVYVTPALQGGGAVYVTDALDAAAVWLHIDHAGSDPDPDAEATLDRELRETLGDDLYQRMIVEFGGALDAAHPHDRDHDFLGVLGSMRKGGGRALLAAHHQLLDGQGRPAYLEAADRSLVPYYNGHGYLETGDAIKLPNGAEMPTMWREPR